MIFYEMVTTSEQFTFCAMLFEHAYFAPNEQAGFGMALFLPPLHCARARFTPRDDELRGIPSRIFYLSVTRAFVLRFGMICYPF